LWFPTSRKSRQILRSSLCNIPVRYMQKRADVCYLTKLNGSLSPVLRRKARKMRSSLERDAPEGPPTALVGYLLGGLLHITKTHLRSARIASYAQTDGLLVILLFIRQGINLGICRQFPTVHSLPLALPVPARAQFPVGPER
jgi:hypothetical protein